MSERKAPAGCVEQSPQHEADVPAAAEGDGRGLDVVVISLVDPA